ncbi:unnamed protein product [Brachionus calyciflorus]|uniref:ATP synthase mitochondrial F1 complex assembly factor 1 n=1 Tax=Brachionus calyciflorus TaxID=104777 RepID=A0A813S4S7_9BILA|nr:unnamed protein product [Brachionus calyciflorus]
MILSLRNFIRVSESTLLKSRHSLAQALYYSTENPDKKDEMDQFKSNPYFAKYEAKLKALYNENPQAFLSNLKNSTPEKIGDGPMAEILNSKMEQALVKKKNLDSIMKTEMLADLPPEEIKNIWSTYMKERQRLSDMLTLNEYQKMRERSTKFNTFLFPMPREQGYEFILSQWSGNECHFTPLINFQAHGENAPGTMKAIYYDDLKETKNIVLEMVEIDTKNLKMEEARLLMHIMKSYYLKCEENDEKYHLMNNFTNKPTEFKHMDLVKQFEKENLKLNDFKEQ